MLQETLTHLYTDPSEIMDGDTILLTGSGWDSDIKNRVFICEVFTSNDEDTYTTGIKYFKVDGFFTVLSDICSSSNFYVYKINSSRRDAMGYTLRENLRVGDTVCLVGPEWPTQNQLSKIVISGDGELKVDMWGAPRKFNDHNLAVLLVSEDKEVVSKRDDIDQKQSIEKIDIVTNARAFISKDLVLELVQNYINYKGFNTMGPIVSDGDGGYSFVPETQTDVILSTPEDTNEDIKV